MSEKNPRLKYFCFLVNAKIENILTHFFILTETSIDHNLFQTREIRSLPGDDKTGYKKFKILYPKNKMFYSLSLQEH